MLQLYSHGGSLLPNLSSLHWNSDGANLPFIMPFVSRSLTSITIDVPSVCLVLPPILTRLPILAPEISKIAVQPLEYVFESSLERASSQLLLQCNPNRLRAYNVDAPLSAPALSHVIQFPLLEEFWLVEPFHFPDPLPDVVFPSLQLLDVEFTRDLAWLKTLPKCPV